MKPQSVQDPHPWTAWHDLTKSPRPYDPFVTDTVRQDHACAPSNFRRLRSMTGLGHGSTGRGAMLALRTGRKLTWFGTLADTRCRSATTWALSSAVSAAAQVVDNASAVRGVLPDVDHFTAQAAVDRRLATACPHGAVPRLRGGPRFPCTSRTSRPAPSLDVPHGGKMTGGAHAELNLAFRASPRHGPDLPRSEGPPRHLGRGCTPATSTYLLSSAGSVTQSP